MFAYCTLITSFFLFIFSSKNSNKSYIFEWSEGFIFIIMSMEQLTVTVLLLKFILFELIITSYLDFYFSIKVLIDSYDLTNESN